MAGIQSYRDLTVWQKAMDLAVAMYALANQLPAVERYGLRAQMTRAAASVPANIAEGNARATRKDYAHFLSIARGSVVETETYLALAVRLGFLRDQDVQPSLRLTTEVGKMLTALRRSLLHTAPPP
jgi:four helix bundle protein